MPAEATESQMTAESESPLARLKARHAIGRQAWESSGHDLEVRKLDLLRIDAEAKELLAGKKVIYSGPYQTYAPDPNHPTSTVASYHQAETQEARVVQILTTPDSDDPEMTLEFADTERTRAYTTVLRARQLDIIEPSEA